MRAGGVGEGVAARAPVVVAAADVDIDIGAEPPGATVDRRTWAGRAVVAAAVLAVFVTLAVTGQGVSGYELATAWQLVDLQVLGDDPAGATWYLHTQPPLHNLVVGLVAWSPLPLAGTLFVLFGLALLVTGLALHDLLVRWGLGPVASGVVVAVALVNPSLPNTVRLASYEIPMAMLVVVGLWAIQRHLDRPGVRGLLLISAVLTAAVLTRSLLHPLWLAAILGLVVAARPLPPRHVAAALAIPLLLVGGWMAKGWVLFDSPTTSSWLGFNMQRGVTGPMHRDDVAAAVRDGTVSPLAQQQPWEGIGSYGEWTDDCRPRHDHPAVDRVVKNPQARTEIANFNAECFLPAYAQAQRDALALVRRSPGRYLETRVPSLVMTYRQVDSGWLQARSWMDAVYEPFLAEVDYAADMRDWNLRLIPSAEELPIRSSLALAACTLLLLARSALAALRLARTGWRAPWPSTEVVLVVVGWTVAVVVLGSSLVEFGENARFRAALDPLLVALPLAALVRWGGARIEARRSPDPQPSTD